MCALIVLERCVDRIAKKNYKIPGLMDRGGQGYSTGGRTRKQKGITEKY